MRRALCLLVLCPGCLCAPPPAVDEVELRAGDSVLRVQLDPFALVLAGASGVVAASARAEPDCAPLALAVRPDDDDGDRYHRPEGPGDDLLWFASTRAALVDGREDLLEVTLRGPAGRDDRRARLQLTAGPHGFVDVDARFDVEERDVALIATCFGLAEGEHAVGGGERFAGVDLRGHSVPLAFAAPGPYASSTNESHVPVPWVATTRGLGLLVESERPGALDVGDGRPVLVARFHGTRLPLRLRAAPIVDNVAAHARRVGLPPPPPRWALAPMQWRNELAVTVDAQGGILSTGRDRILDDARTLRALDIPTTTLWIDAPWQTGYNTFAFNPVQFPDWQGLLGELEGLGFRVLVWATEHVNDSNDAGQMVGMPPSGSLAQYQDFAARGYLVTTSSGEPFHFPWARGNGGYVDFTRPEAGQAYADLARPIAAAGVRGFKLDFCETMRPDLLGQVHNRIPQFFDGSTTELQHVRYARLFHEAFAAMLARERPGDHFIITRTGGLYDQRNGVAIWPGDLDNDLGRSGLPDDDGALRVGGLPAAIAGLLSLAMSGYPLYGSDIGGYRGGPPSTEVLVRWAQFGALSPIMQLGGGGTGDATHNPWDQTRYDAMAVDAYRRAARLHMDLLPSLEAWLARASDDGTPLTLPLGVVMGDDAEAWADAEAFVLGGVLLAAPVIEAGATARTVRFPDGTWLDWWTGQAHVGVSSQVVPAPLETVPLFQAAGSVLWLGDPRLMTAVAAVDAEVADSTRHGDARVVRTSAGPDHQAALVDGSTAAQHSEGDATRVRLDSAIARQLVVDLWLQPDQGPGSAAVVLVDGAAPAEVQGELALWACASTCVLREAHRLRVSAQGQPTEVRFEGGR
jgi:alpha-glucosidase (family GH31 glycosyl hydrolase)